MKALLFLVLLLVLAPLSTAKSDTGWLTDTLSNPVSENPNGQWVEITQDGGPDDPYEDTKCGGPDDPYEDTKVVLGIFLSLVLQR